MRRQIYTFYLDWVRASAEQGFFPVDVSDEFPSRCADLWYGDYYIRVGNKQYGLPRSSDATLICNAVFDRYNADDRPDRHWRRSFSVGDIVQIDRFFYLCRSVGWERLELNAKS
jgi:hypothetical protein